MPKVIGYYFVKHYNFNQIQIHYFNGIRFEKFPSDNFIHDEIEWFKEFDITKMEQILKD